MSVGFLGSGGAGGNAQFNTVERITLSGESEPYELSISSYPALIGFFNDTATSPFDVNLPDDPEDGDVLSVVAIDGQTTSTNDVNLLTPNQSGGFQYGEFDEAEVLTSFSRFLVYEADNDTWAVITDLR